MACERQSRQEIFTGLSCVWAGRFCLAKVSSWIFGNGTAKSLFIVLGTEPALCCCTALSDCITSTIFTSLALVLLRNVFSDSKVYLGIRTSFDPFMLPLTWALSVKSRVAMFGPFGPYPSGQITLDRRCKSEVFRSVPVAVTSFLTLFLNKRVALMQRFPLHGSTVW